MAELIVPGGKGKPTRVLEHGSGGTAAAIDVHELGTVAVETPTERLLLERGNWMIVQAEQWHALLRQLLEAREVEVRARDVLAAAGKAGRKARAHVRQMQKDRRN